MQIDSFLRRIILVLLAVVGVIAAVFLMLFLRTRMQNSDGVVSTPTPSSVSVVIPTPGATQSANAVLTPTPEPTPYADPETIAGGDRGLLVAAVQLRLHLLGYYPYKPTGYFALMTQTAVRDFQRANKLLVDGIVSQQTFEVLFSGEAVYATATPVPIPEPSPPNVRPRNFGEPMIFTDVNSLIPVGSRILVVDLNSQKYFYAQRVGGTRHMEIAPSSEEDMQRYLSIFSGRSTTLDKRPCVIEYKDHIIAGSLCGWLHSEVPNGAQSLCLYYFGSTANDTAMPDVEHNANLLLASNGVLPASLPSPTPK